MPLFLNSLFSAVHSTSAAPDGAGAKQMELLRVVGRIWKERDSFTRQLSMIRANEPSDAELVRRMGAGDEEAFRTIYGRCQGPIFRFALHMSGSRTMAEDVTQEVFMFLLQENSRFDPARGTLQSYLFGIGRNLVLRRVERELAVCSLAEDEPPEWRWPSDERSSAALWFIQLIWRGRN